MFGQAYVRRSVANYEMIHIYVNSVLSKDESNTYQVITNLNIPYEYNQVQLLDARLFGATAKNYKTLYICVSGILRSRINK